jgi:hypothetical protein
LTHPEHGSRYTTGPGNAKLVVENMFYDLVNAIYQFGGDSRETVNISIEEGRRESCRLVIQFGKLQDAVASTIRGIDACITAFSEQIPHSLITKYVGSTTSAGSLTFLRRFLLDEMLLDNYPREEDGKIHSIADAVTRINSIFAKFAKPWGEQSTALQDEQASQNVSSLHNLEFTVLPKTMKAMQVHAHIQAVALKLFPDRKLILADRSSDDGMSVSILKRVTGTFFERLTRFDIAETWMLHSQASTMGSHEQMVGESLLWFVRALQGDSYYGLTTELCKRKYPSLVISKYSIANDTSKYMQVIGNKRPYMGAEDILKFLLSDFARQGPHKYVFEDEMNTMRSPSPPSPPSFLRHTETTVRKEDKTPMLEETTEETTGDTSPVRNKHQTLPPTYDQSLTREYSYAQTQQCRETPALPPEPSNSVSNPSNSVSNPASAQDDFMKTCCDIMKDVECSMQERRLMLGRGDYDEENTKKRKRALAADSIRNVTTILFAANKLLYSDSLYSDSPSSK